jgi:precorrin-2 dehydrogenase / sirohydrochlorin ferrochelatase
MRYPLFLDLESEPVTVIGGGKVAARKVRTLLSAGANVTVVSPVVTSAIQKIKQVRCVKRKYKTGDLRGARLVIAATDDLLVNKKVCTEAKRRKVPVNCVAPPSAGNFIVPSVVRHGGITLAISTGGASPAFAKKLRQDLERFLREGYPALLKRMAKTRQRADYL